MKTTKVRCAYCGVTFERSNKQANRATKVGGGQYCCKSHAISAGNKIRPRGNRKPPRPRRDKYTAFRYYLRNSKNSNRTHGNGLTLAFLKAAWDRQKGICPYAGIIMSLPSSVSGWKNKAPHSAASLDRIDSTKGYTEDNVEFVCRFVNLGKNSGTREETLNFLATLRRGQK